MEPNDWIADWQLELEHQGDGIAPTPPVAADDPFGHRLRSETSPQGPVFSDEAAYHQALERWLEEMPVKLPQGAPFHRVPIGQSCVVCDRACQPTSAADYSPACYVPYAGRRWDCFEFWGRNLTADERRALIAHERRAPRLKLTAPDGSGPALV